MTIEIDESLIGLWFCPLGEDADFLAALREESAGLEIKYRFRYHTTPDAFDGLDRKNWYSARAQNTDKGQVIEGIRSMIAMLPHSGSSYEILRHESETLDEFFERLKECPVVHLKTE